MFLPGWLQLRRKAPDVEAPGLPPSPTSVRGLGSGRSTSKRRNDEDESDSDVDDSLDSDASGHRGWDQPLSSRIVGSFLPHQLHQRKVNRKLRRMSSGNNSSNLQTLRQSLADSYRKDAPGPSVPLRASDEELRDRILSEGRILNFHYRPRCGLVRHSLHALQNSLHEWYRTASHGIPPCIPRSTVSKHTHTPPARSPA